VSGFAAPDSTVAKAIKVPTLILHGDKDNVVPASRSESLKSVLDENKVPCLRHVYVGEGHNIIHSQYDDMVDRIANWLVLHGVLKK
jgi:dipeptidyl aminopeptidase/acylaminoacyl peptidase